jgi:hypothetical protein
MGPGDALPLAPPALELTLDVDGDSDGFWEGERRRILLLTGAQPRRATWCGAGVSSIRLLAACHVAAGRLDDASALKAD